MAATVTRHFAFKVGACAALALTGGAAGAQTMSANSASYNAGYGRYAGQENRPVEVSSRDANGNLVIVNGIIGGASAFADVAASASAGAGAGVGTGGATAIGNNLVVITQGDNNTVIVDSIQKNTGAVTATQSGGVGGNGS